MSYLNDLSEDVLAIWITPDDVGAKVYSDAKGTKGPFQDGMIKATRIWKKALWGILASKAALDPASAEKGQQWLKKLEPPQIRLLDVLSVVNPQRKHAHVALYIDDLDRAWAGTMEDKVAVAGLIYALRDMTRDNSSLRTRISLRNDVYWDVRAADQGLDKIEASVVNVKWSLHEILVMLVKRIESWLGHDVDERALLCRRQDELAPMLDPLFEPCFPTRGPWARQGMHKVILSLVRRRPRDMVKLCTFAARAALRDQRHKISGRDLLDVIPEYSKGRIQDLISEFRQSLPYVDRLVLGMRPTRRELQEVEERRLWHYRTDRLIKKLRDILQHIGLAGPPDALSAAHWLYKIGFLTARLDREDGYIERRYFDDNPHLLTPAVGDGGFSWEVHPAYREALNPHGLVDWKSNVEVESWSL
jgi:hypothetical protein